MQVVVVAVGRWDGRRNRPVPDAVWLEQHRRALPFVLKRENEREGAAAPRLVSTITYYFLTIFSRKKKGVVVSV